MHIFGCEVDSGAGTLIVCGIFACLNYFTSNPPAVALSVITNVVASATLMVEIAVIPEFPPRRHIPRRVVVTINFCGSGEGCGVAGLSFGVHTFACEVDVGAGALSRP